MIDAVVAGDAGYTARDIEVLEGLEPVRRRPGMYIGGTDEKALHHLFAEVIDNSMDEAVAGHASFIEVRLDADGFLSVTDNGAGLPAAMQAVILHKPVESTKAHGTGLGLTICRHIASAHQAEMKVESRPGGGTVFILEFPLAAG